MGREHDTTRLNGHGTARGQASATAAASAGPCEYGLSEGSDDARAGALLAASLAALDALGDRAGLIACLESLAARLLGAAAALRDTAGAPAPMVATLTTREWVGARAGAPPVEPAGRRPCPAGLSARELEGVTIKAL